MVILKTKISLIIQCFVVSLTYRLHSDWTIIHLWLLSCECDVDIQVLDLHRDVTKKKEKKIRNCCRRRERSIVTDNSRHATDNSQCINITPGPGRRSWFRTCILTNIWNMCEVSIGEGVHLNAARRAHPPSPRRIFDFFLARLASSAKELLICISWNMGGGEGL